MADETIEQKVMRLEGDFNDMEALVKELDKILVRGNGKPSLQEDMRTVLSFNKSIQFWMTTLALTFIAQFVAVGISMTVVMIRAMPLLTELITKNSLP